MDSTDPVGGVPGQHLHRENIEDGPHDYSIDMGGGLDGPSTRDPVGYGNYNQAWENNLWVRLENTGDSEIINPWLCANGRDWRSLESILDGILEPGMDDAEKARAIWEFARRHRYHFTTGDDEVKDTVKMLNVYGYTLCWDEAYTIANLWRGAGLKTRRGFPHGHCTTEVFYDGEYHLMDSDEHLLVLRRDNRTVAGESDITRDHDLLKRSHAYGILAPENRRTAEGAAALFVHEGPRAGERRPYGGHRMDLRLRPGEALVWAWQDRGLSHGPRPPRMCNGRLEYTPRLDAGFAAWPLEAKNLRSTAEGLRPATPNTPSLLHYAIASPYVLVGARLEAQVESGRLFAEFSLDGHAWKPFLRGKGLEEIDVRFADALPKTPAPYACHVRLRGEIALLRRLQLGFDLQMAPLSLPGLRLGHNRLRYSDQSPNRRVRLTHAWRERAAVPPPVPRPTFPIGDTVAGTQFTFAWQAVAQATDYHFELSEYADFRYSLSPVFEKLSSRTSACGAPRWRIPEEGLLNPDTPYYWRVRARYGTGLWGPFCAPQAFSIRAPATPEALHLDLDWEKRRAILHWEDGAGGTPPERYEIHASDERGFSAARRSRAVFGGSHGEDWTQPPTLVQTVADRHCVVIDPAIHTNARAFYRVVAVDGDGVRSGASDWIGMPRPFICSLPPRSVEAGRLTMYQVRCVGSTGDLRSVSHGPQRYASARREGDCWRFLLDEGPAWLSLNEISGLLLASPPADQLGLHTVTLRVSDGQGRTDVQGFDLEVTSPGAPS